ncbi:MAG: O-antigen ligase family protein [Methylovulum sp.]|uniref:O-antigen ligase family protein n=1 Tax=Methylovulum sp. TaxID=1916980 RepID=UPI002613D9EA|nr:O-antigen ligase family protein [Methylovulum sp.]MDD2725378.1 O-antigen ligase family protein [Methylovulum sp.]MDD5126290.1 O-antigen ligase family protein [Methylovulum sp.]
MRLQLENDLPKLLFALVCVSVVAALPQVESAWLGIKEVYGEQDFGLRILRELMLVVLVGYAFFEPRLRQGISSSSVLAFMAVIATYVLFEIGYAGYLDLPLVVPMAGLRVFEYLPLALLGFVVSRLDAGDYVLNRFAHYLRYYIALEAVLAIAQALFAPPLFGVSFLGGGRPFGTFVSPNLFGATMATCALVFALIPSMRLWVFVSVFLALLSGSRTAFISSLLVVYFQLYALLRPRDRWALVMPAPVLAVGALVLASSPLLSGRDDADPTQDGRLDLWQRIFSHYIRDPMDLLFGWGLGLSSNTINILYGAEHFQGQFDSDSLYLFLLNGYGLVGLLAYLGFLWMTTRMSIHPHKGLVVMFIFIAGLTFNMWEYFPQNALLMYLWGMVLGTSLELIPSTGLGTSVMPGKRYV